MLVDLVLVFLVCLALRVFGFAEFKWVENPWYWLGCAAAGRTDAPSGTEDEKRLIESPL